MGFISSALESRQKSQNRGDRLNESMQRLMMLQAERQAEEQQRIRSEAAQRLSILQKESTDPMQWKGATPEKIGTWQAAQNKERQILGLPLIDSLIDPRKESVMQDKAEAFKMAKDGIPMDFAWNWLVNRYGEDYLNGDDFGMVSNIAANGGFEPAPVLDESQLKPGAKPKSEGLSPEQAQQPQSDGVQMPTGSTPQMQAEPVAQGMDIPQGQPAPPKQIRMGASARDNFRAMYEQYQSALDPNEIEDLIKAMNSEYGVALLRQMPGGESKLHTIGKTMGLDESLWTRDKESYFTQVQDMANQNIEKAKKAKNATALLRLHDGLIKDIAQQGDPAAITTHWFPIAQSYGYEGAEEQFFNFVNSMKPMTAQQEGNLTLGNKRTDETIRHNKAMEELGTRRMTEQERRNKVSEAMGWDRIKISKYNSSLSAARNALAQTIWNVKSVQNAIKLETDMMERQTDIQGYLSDKTLPPTAVKALQDEFDMIQGIREGMAKKANSVPQVKAQQGNTPKLTKSSNIAVTQKVNSLAKKNGIEPIVEQLRKVGQSDDAILAELEKRY